MTLGNKGEEVHFSPSDQFLFFFFFFPFFCNVKLLQSKSSSERQDSLVSFKSNLETRHKEVAIKMKSCRNSNDIYTLPTNSCLSENPIVVSNFHSLLPLL